MPYPMYHPNCRTHPVDELTAAQFAAEFPTEGEYIEFKEGAARDRIAQAAVAFSNADGGVILLGVTDGGLVKGADLSVSSETSLRQTLDQVRDLGPYRIHRLRVDGRAVVAVSVARRRGSFAQLPNGQVKQRRGASNRTLLGADLADFIARRFARSVESSPTRLTFNDIDADLGRQLAEVWYWKVASGRSQELLDRLRDNGFLVLNGDRDRLSVAGALFLLPNPSAVLGKVHVEVFRYPNNGNDYDRRQEFTGPLHNQVAGAAAFVLEELGVDLATIGVLRHELHRLPQVVVREAIANAVAHRSYTAVGEPVRVEMRPERVIIRSPGTLPSGVSLDNLSQRSVARNTLVIRTLRYFGVAEDAGRGVGLMYRHMALNLMAPPVFEADDSSVTVTLRLGSSASPLERAWLAQTFTSAAPTPGQPYSIGDGESAVSLEPSDLRLLVRASRGETLSNTAVRNLLGIDASRASRTLAQLRDRGFLHQRGKGAGAIYALSPDIARPDGTHIETRDFHTEVLEHALAGPITNTDVRAITGLDRTAAVKVLNHLVAEGLLDRHGSRRGTHYRLRRIWGALKLIAKSDLVFSALTADHGSDVAESAAGEVRDVLRRAIASTATETATFEASEGAFAPWRWTTTCRWTKWERALLAAAGRGLTRGLFIEEVCELVDRTDQICRTQVQRLAASGEDDPVSLVVAATYIQTAARTDGRGLPASYVAKAFEMATMMQRFFPDSPSELASRLTHGAHSQSWGRFYLALRSVALNDVSDQALFASLLGRAWAAGGYHLQLEALDAAKVFASSYEPHRSDILETVTRLNSDHWALQSTLIEVLARFGEIENPTTVEELRGEIRKTISHPDSIEHRQAASGIVSRQFEDQAIVGPYFAAVDGLTDKEKVQLFTMAAFGADRSIPLHVQWTLERLAELVPTGVPALDTAARSVFATFLDGLPENTMLPAEAVGACLAAIGGWAKFSPALPPENDEPTPAQRNWRAIANLLLGQERYDAVLDTVEAWRTLLGEPKETIRILASLESAARSRPGPQRDAYEQLIDTHREQLCQLFGWALDNPAYLPGNRLYRGANSPNFVMAMLGVVGDEATADRLRTHIHDPEVGRAASDAIQQINRRLARSSRSPR